MSNHMIFTNLLYIHLSWWKLFWNQIADSQTLLQLWQ